MTIAQASQCIGYICSVGVTGFSSAAFVSDFGVEKSQLSSADGCLVWYKLCLPQQNALVHVSVVASNQFLSVHD